MNNNFTLEEDTTPIPNSLKTFWVQITIEIPYPKVFEYREKANFCGTAINRALRRMRKELNGKHLSKVKIIANRI